MVILRGFDHYLGVNPYSTFLTAGLATSPVLYPDSDVFPGHMPMAHLPSQQLLLSFPSSSFSPCSPLSPFSTLR